jgi:AcrR family transcriptional regulator
MVPTTGPVDVPSPPARRRGRPPVENLEERRREQVIASALALFCEQGYEATTTSDIARHAGVGQGTIYRYVSSKRDLLDLVFDSAVEEVLAALQPMLLADEPPTRPAELIDRIDEAIAGIVETFDRRPELLALVLVEAVAIDEELRLRVLGLEATLARIVTRWCEDAKDAGCIRPAVDPDVFGMMATKMLLPAALREVMGQRDPQMRNRHRAAVIDLVRYGLFADVGDERQ